MKQCNFCVYVVTVLTLWSMSSIAQSAITLKVTDTHNNVVEISNPKIDYTTYSITYKEDFEYTGIRVLQGSGRVAIKWSQVKDIQFSNPGDYTLTGSLKATMHLKKGDTMTVDIINPSLGGGNISKGRLQGKSSLGEYTIDLYKLKTIEVVSKQK